MAERTDAGTFALDLEYRSTHFGHRRGIVAVCSTEDPKTTAGYLEHVLQAAEKLQEIPKGKQFDYHLKTD